MTCERCVDPVEHGDGKLFQVRGWDYSESTGAHFEGQLCLRCWNRFVDFMLGRPVFEHPGRIVVEEVFDA